METFWKNFKFKKVAQGKDILEVYIKEGLDINKYRPKVNNMMGNGFIR